MIYRICLRPFLGGINFSILSEKKITPILSLFWIAENARVAARTYAFIKRRGYVIPEDVRAVAHDVLRHRIGLTYEAEASNVTSDEIVSKILNKVEVP